VGHGVAVLDSAVVAGCDDGVVAYEDGSDGKTALGERLAGLENGGGEEGVGHGGVGGFGVVERALGKELGGDQHAGERGRIGIGVDSVKVWEWV